MIAYRNASSQNGHMMYSLYQFRTSIHARPPGQLASVSATLGGHVVDALQLAPAEQVVPMMLDFEAAQRRLERLPRMFVELDGSFVWVGEWPRGSWQVDGCLYDRESRLVYVEAAGSCPVGQFDQLLGALGWPAQELIYQLPQQAIFLNETQFRRYASARV